MFFKVFGLVDAIIDPIAQRIAENITENMDVVAQNRLARELAELSNEQLSQKGLSREKLEQGSDAYPWQASSSSTSLEDLEEHLLCLMDVGFDESKQYSQFVA